MPVLNGFTATARIREHHELPKIPIVAVTPITKWICALFEHLFCAAKYGIQKQLGQNTGNVALPTQIRVKNRPATSRRDSL